MTSEQNPQCLDEHVADCAECQSHTAAIHQVDHLLACSIAVVDADRLTANASFLLRSALEANAADALWRRVIAALTLALAPLPLVLVYDAFLLRAMQSVLASLVPGTVATYVIFSYAALLALLLAGTYAAIPIAMGQATGLKGSRAQG